MVTAAITVKSCPDTDAGNLNLSRNLNADESGTGKSFLKAPDRKIQKQEEKKNQKWGKVPSALSGLVQPPVVLGRTH